MSKDFFETNYTEISTLYNNYINSEKYMHHPIVNYVEPTTSKALDEALALLEQGKKLRASDALVEASVMYEQSGFIQGFALAMNFMQECVVGKVTK